MRKEIYRWDREDKWYAESEEGKAADRGEHSSTLHAPDTERGMHVTRVGEVCGRRVPRFAATARDPVIPNSSRFGESGFPKTVQKSARSH